MVKRKRVAVIGAGLGGLSAAIRLAVNGFDVDLYEQGDKAGGKANQISLNGFRFDTGPSLLTMPFVIKELFEYSGERIEDYLELIPLRNLCKYFYPDKTIINAYADVGKFAEEISTKTIDAAQSVKQYLKYAEKIYELTAELFLFSDFSDRQNFYKPEALKTLFQINKIDPFRTMHQANKSFFKDPKTIQLFDRYATYNGSNPYKAPATLNIIQHVEYNLGGFILKQGVYSLVEALYNLAKKKGVKFFFNSKVTQILQDNFSVKGLLVNRNGIHEKKEYDVVIANADVNYTYKNLLNNSDTKSAKRYSKLEPSSSAMVFYWGVKGRNENLDVHNILFSKDYKKEFIDLFEKQVCPEDPTVYIYISSKFNISDAPEDHENWYVMINAPYIQNQNWNEELQKSRNNIIKKINEILGIDVETKIIFEKVLTPEMIEQSTSSFRGSLYGISSNGKSAAFVRQKIKSKEYNGLYFCGGSAHPGGGIPLVILSGKLAAEAVMKS
ncbi:MAG: phytoene desaturase [Ignavibacteria bacterium]|nr:phytoene desaturase [Ignavibacteria bacterium]